MVSGHWDCVWLRMISIPGWQPKTAHGCFVFIPQLPTGNQANEQATSSSRTRKHNHARESGLFLTFCSYYVGSPPASTPAEELQFRCPFQTSHTSEHSMGTRVDKSRKLKSIICIGLNTWPIRVLPVSDNPCRQDPYVHQLPPLLLSLPSLYASPRTLECPRPSKEATL